MVKASSLFYCHVGICFLRPLFIIIHSFQLTISKISSTRVLIVINDFKQVVRLDKKLLLC